jgi:poly(hydroxyalkanoate) depolymerase family esterase
MSSALFHSFQRAGFSAPERQDWTRIVKTFAMADMTEVTRLTREGRLDEATRLLQGVHAPQAPRPERMKPASWMPHADTTQGQQASRLRPFAAWPSGATGHRQSAWGGSAPVLADGARFDMHIHQGLNKGARAQGYKLYIPSRYDGLTRVPLVVMLHGCTQSPDDFALGTGMNALAEEETFLVAYPEQTQAANSSRCWNWFRAGDQTRDSGEPALIAGLTRDVMANFSVDEKRVFVAGLSAGGAQAAIMGTTYPELYAAVGVHSGLACGAARDLPSALSAMRQGPAGSSACGEDAERPSVATIVFHGEADRTVHPANAGDVSTKARAGHVYARSESRGVSQGGISYVCTREVDGDGRVMLEHWQLDGVGHAWSGGNAAGSYTEPRGPDAAREMMRFFRQVVA